MASIRFAEGAEGIPVVVDHTQQLLPNVVDGMARARPEAVYALIPRSYTTYDDGFRKVTYRLLANAVNGIAWLLTEQLGRGSSAEPLAYIGPNDIGYIVVILGASKAGYSILSPSPRNTRANQANLFAAIQCKTVLTLAPPYAPAVTEITEGVTPRPRLIHVPGIYDLLNTAYRHFPYPQTFDTLKHAPLAIVHTSGTTGNPKVLTYTHESASSFARELREPAPEGYYNLISLVQSCRVFAMFPFFHAGSLFAALFDGIVSQTTIVSPLAGVPPSVDSLVEGLKHVDVDTLLLPAPFVDQIAKDPAAFALVTSRVRSIGYGGAEISTSAGDAFAAAGVLPVSYYGSTETMTIPGIRPHERPGAAIVDWQYVQPHPYVNARFEPTPSQPDLYELVIVRNPDPARTQPVFTLLSHPSNSNDDDEGSSRNLHHTRDLWSPHPHRPNLWRYRGRADDVLVAATGELIHPQRFEQHLVGVAPDVSAALLLGTGRWRTALLVEPALHARETATADPRNFVIAKLWPDIQRANDADLLSRTARIASPDFVVLTVAERPLPRAQKGTVQRAAALELYAAEIEDMYARNGDGVRGCERPLPVHLDLGEHPAGKLRD